MKCPKCGFNSFEYYDSCKKCSNDLVGYKQTYGITSMVLPIEAKEKLAAEFRSAENDDEHNSGSVETHDDMFAFDIPETAAPSFAVGNDDPFNFDEPAGAATQGGSSQAGDDVFADLLESTSQADDSPFGAASAVPQSPPAVAAAKAPDASATGEFDLENFSWDDTPVATAATVAVDTAESLDDFDSLFGDTKENGSK